MRPTALHPFVRGKVANDRGEDLLTGLAFGTLAWVPAPLGILRLLQTAIPRPVWLDATLTLDVKLWPWWNHAEDADGAEPDAVLRTTLRDGTRGLLAVEAKRDAGKSGTGERDQLARQWHNGAALAAAEGREFVGVLYLTRHLARPEEELKASREAVGRDLGAAPLCWCSWTALRAIALRASLELAPTAPMLSAQCNELAQLLERWGMARFEGMSELRPVPPLSVPTRFAWPHLTDVPPLPRIRP